MLPLRRKGDTLEVAVTDPHDERLFDELQRITASKLSIVLSSRSDIQRYITEVHGFKRSVARAEKEMGKPSTDLGNLEQLVRLSRVEDIEVYRGIPARSR